MAITRREFDSATMDFCVGFDTLKGEVKGPAMTGTPGTLIGGVTSNFYYQKVESIEDFLKALQVSASASFQASAGNGSAKANFASQVKMHDYSLYLVAIVHVKIGSTQLNLQSRTLNPDAAALLATDVGQQKFRKSYGDQFLNSIVKGGEFYSLMEIRTSNQSDYENLKVKIAGSYAGGMAQGSASLNSTIQDIKSFSQISIMANQSGGGSQAVPLTPDELTNKASTFADSVTADHAFDFEAVFEDYDLLPQPPLGNPIDIQAQRDALEKMAILRLRYQQKVDSADYALFNKDEFASFNSEQLTKDRNALNDTLNELTAQASACFNDHAKCPMPTITDPSIVLPERLTKDQATKVEAAKKAADDAEGHATACKQHANRVVTISLTIQPGPQGKALADEAKAELDNALAASQLAQDAANVAITSGAATPTAEEYATKAKSSAHQANDAVATAASLLDSIHVKGYAPYWKSSTRVALLMDTNNNAEVWGAGFSLRWGNSPSYHTWPDINNFAVDPLGDPLEIRPGRDDAIHDVHTQYRDRWRWNPSSDWTSIITDPYISVDENANDPTPNNADYHLFSVSWYAKDNKSENLHGKEIVVELILRSKKSGLSTKISLSVYAFKSSITLSKPYMLYDGTIVS